VTGRRPRASLRWPPRLSHRCKVLHASERALGLAVATHLAARGVPVFATVRSDADAERLDRIDGVEALICDVTDDAQVARLRAAIDARGDGLWGIVHNAGIAHIGPLTTTSLDDMRAVFEVNVFGVHRVTNALSDLIVASRGRIVTMSSISGTLSSTLLGAYTMTKHALEAYTDSLAKQLAPLGVHVCAVVPGNFESAISRNAVERFAPPADASEELKAWFAPDADTSRSQFPGPEPVAAACHATRRPGRATWSFRTPRRPISPWRRRRTSGRGSTRRRRTGGRPSGSSPRWMPTDRRPQVQRSGRPWGVLPGPRDAAASRVSPRPTAF
jgi:NAD(P)-dependent dehydrogenase (short-subunit alcohol dehydrogenase family)